MIVSRRDAVRLLKGFAKQIRRSALGEAQRRRGRRRRLWPFDAGRNDAQREFLADGVELGLQPNGRAVDPDRKMREGPGVHRRRGVQIERRKRSLKFGHGQRARRRRA